jgi:glycosyltransferase involved in cell wall biosynthesis
MTLSLIIISNTEKLNFNNNLLKLVEEVIVVNKNGTNVKNKKIKVFNFVSNNFSELRNFGLEKAKGEWILFIDSDEEFSTELIKEIPKLIEEQNIDGFWFRRKNFISPTRYLKYGLFYPDYQFRLFRNNKEYRYSGAVHEQLNIPIDKTKEVHFDILHHPTNPKYSSFSDIRNFQRYINLDATEKFKLFVSPFKLVFLGKIQFLRLFFGGFFRGKGFLDGWAGFRAHILFAYSISAGYFLAAWWKIFPSSRKPLK